MDRRVVVSYSRSDRTYVDQLAAYLGAQAIPVWYDRSIEAGAQFTAVIQQQIDACLAVVVVCTPSAMASEWVNREITYAVNQHKPILPLVLAPSPAHILLADRQQENVIGGRMPDGAFVSRLRALGGVLPAMAPAPAPAPMPLLASGPGSAPRPSVPSWALLEPGEQVLLDLRQIPAQARRIARLFVLIGVASILIALAGVAVGAQNNDPAFYGGSIYAGIVGLLCFLYLPFAPRLAPRYLLTNRRVLCHQWSRTTRLPLAGLKVTRVTQSDVERHHGAGTIYLRQGLLARPWLVGVPEVHQVERILRAQIEANRR
jgi:hypothetical protein